MKVREVDVKKLGESEAVERYIKCPRIITAVGHAAKADDTEFHTIFYGLYPDEDGGAPRPYCIKRVFSVPKQKLLQVFDPTYGRYLVVQVTPQFELSSGHEGDCLLFISVEKSSGFLVPFVGLDIGKYEIFKSSPIIAPSALLQMAICNQGWFSGGLSAKNHLKMRPSGN